MNYFLARWSPRFLFVFSLTLLCAGFFHPRYSGEVFAQPNISAPQNIRTLPPGGQSPRPRDFPRRTIAPAQAGHSIVKGRVVYKDNLKPLKGARVHVFPAYSDSSDSDLSAPPGIVAFTNNSGEFQIPGLAAGKYYVTVGGAGLSSPSGLGMRLPIPISAIPRREDFEGIVPRHDAQFTVDGTNTAEVEIAIVRGGAISGKVMQPNRAPLTDVTVNIISREGTPGAGTMQFTTQTDRHGEYRLENVPPGEYVVAAAVEDKQGSFDIRSRMRGESQMVTYHPAAITVRDATAVRVESGHETTGVNVTLITRNEFSISGTVVRQHDGTPVAGATVVLRNPNAESGGMISPGMRQRSTESDSSGNWSFSGVQEGSYIATALVPTSPLARPTRMRSQAPELGRANGEPSFRGSRPRFLIAQQEVLVSGADLKQLTLMIVGPGSIRGSVSLEDGSALPADFVIFLELVRDGARPERPLPIRVMPDGSFSLNDVQGGDVYVNLALIPGAPYVLKSLTVNGTDPRQSQLRIIEGAETGPLQVVVSASSGQLSGRVVSEKNGEGLSDYTVLLAPVRNELQRFRTSYLTARTAADGTFQLTGEPGEYFVFARQRGDFPAIITEDFVRVEGSRAQRIKLTAGETSRLDVKIP
ncbi:MAG TPA: carboxypeptidase-like regulatory domain-containing protein [Pyrinomonadaceae bacterium]|nr:carboxypeptidase-like regulatory domain-containing protein [Pyrinomonadaceae bacterium]